MARWESEYTAALIGCGRIGYSLGLDKKREQPASHTMALQANTAIRLVCGCDTNSLTLDQWHKANKKCQVYTNSANLYARHKPEIIVIAVNENAHLKETLDAIATNPKLIILEKPVALNMAEAMCIKDAAQSHNVPILVNHERRFSDDYNFVKSILAEIGPLQSINASLFSGMRVFSEKEETTGNYSLLHDGTHLIDIVLFLLEDEEASTVKNLNELKTASGLLQAASLFKTKERLLNSILYHPVISGLKRDEEKNVRNLSAHYKTQKCPDVTITINGSSKYFGFDIDIRGSEGRILIGNGYFKLFRRQESKLYSNFYSLEEDKSVKVPKKTGFFSNMVQNAVDFLDGEAQLKSSLQNGINALAVIDEIKDSIRM